MATISPGDAAVALRTFPRRWQALFRGGDDDGGVDGEGHGGGRGEGGGRAGADVTRHPGPDGRSALDCATEAAALLEAAGADIAAARRGQTPALDRRDDGQDRIASPGRSSGDALRRIEAAAPALARTVDELSTGELDRTATMDGATVTVRSLIADVVDDVAGLLRTAGDAVRAGRAASS